MQDGKHQEVPRSHAEPAAVGPTRNTLASVVHALENVPRSVVFAGTVNHGSYLRDTTGNRRYWVVRCEGPIDVDGLRSARDALWAEATHLYRAGEAWHLAAGEDALMADETEARVDADPWEEAIAAWAAGRARAPGDPSFTMDEVLSSALGLLVSSRNSRVTGRVSRVLGRLGYERRRRAALPRTYHYVRSERLTTPPPADVPPSHRPTWLTSGRLS